MVRAFARIFIDLIRDPWMRPILSTCALQVGLQCVC